MPRRPLRSFLAGLLVAAALAAVAAPATVAVETPEPYRSLPERLRARIADFPELPAPTTSDDLAIHAVALNRDPVVFDSGHAFSAIRFRAPAQPGLDLVWAFSTPASWRHWYILPAEGDAGRRGFKNWLDSDRAYVGLDATAKAPASLQTLEAAYFEPGREYLLWFCQTRRTEDPAELKAVLRFAPPPADGAEWDREAIETALGLKTAPTAAQAAYFASRGARILLDRDLFHSEDAQSQIDHFLFTRRQTEFSRGGFFVTIETATPTCHASPDLATIIARHGDPDFSLSAAEQNRLRAEKSEPAEYDRHHFDHFVFETAPGDPLGPVRRVSSQYADASEARPSGPDAAGDTWTEFSIRGRAFRLFFKAGREVARYADWGDPAALRLGLELPAGEYLRRYPTGERMEKLVHDRSSRSTYESWYQAGPAYRRCEYKNGRLDGELVDTFENGRERARLTYREGVPQGRFTEWNEQGEVVRELDFIDGKPARRQNDPAR